MKSRRLRERVLLALDGTGLNLAATTRITHYDERVPIALRSASLMPEARGLLVIGSAGRALWAAFQKSIGANPSRVETDHPLDAFVAAVLGQSDEVLSSMGIAYRRFEPTLYAEPMLDFRVLGELVGLGSMGPFGMLIHPEHGPWWALRAAYFVDAEVEEPARISSSCAGCPAPCVSEHGRAAEGAGFTEPSVDLSLATVRARVRCIVGQASRYTDEQIAFHYDRPL